jgi:uncharacterized repeat protein (TIGR01451 family)
MTRRSPARVFGPAFRQVSSRTNTIDYSANTFPGGPIDFQLAVTNSGNSNVKDFQAVNILPFVGDTGVKVGVQPRYSQFTPELVGPIRVPTGYLVEYSTESNPCRPELNPIGVVGCVAPAWTTTPASYSTVRSFRLTLVGTGGVFDGSNLNGPVQTDDAVLEIGEELVVQFSMKVPLLDAVYDLGSTSPAPYDNLNPPSQLDISPALQTNCHDLNTSGDNPALTPDRCPVARNSFAYRGTSFSVDGKFSDVFLGSEPPRAEVAVYGLPNNGIGDTVWLDANTDGIQQSTELPMSGVRVELVDVAGNPVVDFALNPVPAAFTDANGWYQFVNLADGDYKARFFPPTGYTVSPADVGDPNPGIDSGAATADGSPNAAADSDGLAVEGQTYVETPLVHLLTRGGAGEYDLTWDLGLYRTPINLRLAESTLATTVSVGDTVTYTVVVTNDGPGTALAGWSVVDLPGVGLTLVTMSGTGVTCSTLPTCVGDGALASGGSVTITVTATVDASASGTLRNVAYVAPKPIGEIAESTPLGTLPTRATDTVASATDNDGHADVTVRVPVEVVVLPINLRLTESTLATTVSVGDTVTYTVVVTNDGPGAALAGWSVVDLPGVGLTLVSMSGAGVTCSTLPTCVGDGALASGGSVTITVTATVDASASGTLRNVAYVAPKPIGEIAESTPLGTLPTRATDTVASATDNDGHADVTVRVPVIEVAVPASLGDSVWYDVNQNGQQDLGETGVGRGRGLRFHRIAAGHVFDSSD